MVRVRCTQRALKRFKLEVDVEGDADPSTTLLGDWYANLLNVERQRWVLCVSERTLLPVLVPARNDCFPVGLSNAVADVLRELGVPDAAVEHEIGEMESVVVDRTRSRSVLGVMNVSVRRSTHGRRGREVIDWRRGPETLRQGSRRVAERATLAA